MIGIIYSYKSPSGKYYIGQTRHERQRKLQHSHKGSKCRKFRLAIAKYGLDNFEYSVLVRFDGSEDQVRYWLNKMEIYYIKKHDSYNNGYNATRGGDTCWNEGKTGVYSDEAKRKMSEAKIGRSPANKGQKMSAESRAKMSKARMGKEPWNKGRPGLLSEESRANMSKHMKGRMPANAKAIDVFDMYDNLLGSFTSMAKASEFAKVSKPSILKCLRGLKSSIKGKRFAYHGSSTTSA